VSGSGLLIVRSKLIHSRQSLLAALSDSSSGAAAAPAAPLERKKLQLAARSSTTSSEVASPPASASSTTSNKPNPFGAAAPVDTAAREQALLDARIEKERAQAEERRQKAEADAAAAALSKKPAASPFGAAKPVDVTQREKEVEEKLRKEKEEGISSTTKAMGDAKIAEEKSANPKKEWRRPAGPHAGLTGAQASAPQSQVAKKTGRGILIQ
jgi:translation initiation factor 4B